MESLQRKTNKIQMTFREFFETSERSKPFHFDDLQFAKKKTAKHTETGITIATNQRKPELAMQLKDNAIICVFLFHKTFIEPFNC